MAVFTGIDTSDSIRVQAAGRTMTEKRFWATEQWLEKPYLTFTDDIGEELRNRGHSMPWLGLFEDTALEDWRTYWSRRGAFMRDYRTIWTEELGNDLARHEFQTRITQKIEAAGAGNDTEAIVSFAMGEYEKAKDQEMLGGTDA